ncbi:MAG: hypothetical protein K2H85_09365, partial [Allobaculum sp.]|nr:hypothetical protein [Allobaculum sp.]
DNNGVLDFNENYTLKEIWLAVEDSQEIKEKSDDQEGSSEEEDVFDEGDTIAFQGELKNDLEEEDFVHITVPEATNFPNHHDPSQIYFTNDPNNDKLRNEDGWKVTIKQVNGKDIKYSEKTDRATSETENELYPIGSIMIYVPDGLIIRFIFDPLKVNNYVNDTVDFFDYDITNGFIYATPEAARNAYSNPDSMQLIVYHKDSNKFYKAKKEGDKYIQEVNGSYAITNEEVAISWNSNTGEFASNTPNIYCFPTETQEKLNQLKWYALTYEQGINHNVKYNPDSLGSKPYYQLAFGNQNTNTGLGDLTWNFTEAQNETVESKDFNNYVAYLNESNINNSFSYDAPDSSKNRLYNPNLKGATYNLASNIAAGPAAPGSAEETDFDNQVIQWSLNGGDSSTLEAPSLFDIYNTDHQPGMTVYSKDLKTTDYFPLSFSRLGGTFTLEKVLHGKPGQEKDNYKEIESASKLDELVFIPDNTLDPRTNNFWPMDDAPSYGANGHDLKFGSTATPIPEAVGNKSNPDILPSQSNSTNITSDEFPSSDDKTNHNSYFGMKVQIPFTMEDGYAAPLNYFFYGDDDMFVFLSKCERDAKGNVTKIYYGTTQLVADIGGVHSSLGTYVNLWNFIGSENKRLINTVDGGNGLEDIYYYKTTPLNSSEAKDNESTEDIPHSVPHQDYVLSIFYTERGASGSSCYMRFNVPFEGLTTVNRAQDGEIYIGKEVKSAVIAESDDNKAEETKYVFQLDLVNADQTYFTNRYPIVIHNEDHTVALQDSIINCNPKQIAPTITGENKDRYQTITNQGRFTLTPTQHAYVYGLPRTGPYEGEYTFTITEVGTYIGENQDKNNLYSEENVKELSSGTTTTFRSGQFSNDPNNDLFGKNEWVSGFQESNSFKGEINAQNKVEFVNALAPTALKLEKKLTTDIPEDFEGSFTFEIKLTSPEGKQFTSVPWFSSIPPDGSHENNPPENKPNGEDSSNEENSPSEETSPINNAPHK